MVPLVGTFKELQHQANVINTTAGQVFDERGEVVDYKIGTMIEVPRAALTADKIAEVAVCDVVVCALIEDIAQRCG